MRILAPTLVLLLLLAASAQTPSPKEQPPTKRPNAENLAGPAADQAEIDALKADLLRMNSLLNQMRTNLGYVASTTQPLQHQFQLEIDMWQIEISRTERHLQRLQAGSKR